MNNFEHFLMTKFNVRTFTQSGLNLEWLNHRFNLFEQFCYPTILNQSSQNFKWLVFFDSQTPEFFRDKLRKYSQWENFIPIYVDGYVDGQYNIKIRNGEIYREELLKYRTEKTEYLITTTIDNDDGIHQDFIKTIQDNFHNQEFEFISFSHGYVLHKGKIYLLKYVANPFVTLVERINRNTIDGFTTAICVAHTDIIKMGPVKQIKNQPYWLQVIHERNVNNRVRGFRQPIGKLNLENNFLINPEYILVQEDQLSLWMERLVSVPRVALEPFLMNLPSPAKVFLKKLIGR